MGTNPGEHFNIRWKNYTSVLHSVFRDLLEEERLVDVTLGCEGGFIKCHRIVLTACSSYFENLLQELQAERHVVIFMKDMKMWELRALIHFMYNGEVSVKQNRLAPLVKAAEALHIRGLSADTGEGGGGRYNNHNEHEEEEEEEEAYDNYSADIAETNKPSIIKRNATQTHQQQQPAKVQALKRPSSSTSSTNGPPKLLKINKMLGGNGGRAPIVVPLPRSINTAQVQRGENGVAKNKLPQIKLEKSPTIKSSPTTSAGGGEEERQYETMEERTDNGNPADEPEDVS
jgi:hypothetical protein